MKRLITIWFALWSCMLAVNAQKSTTPVAFDFYGDSVAFDFNKTQFVDYHSGPEEQKIQFFYNALEESHILEPAIASLNQYRQQHQPDDWLYYQLVRKTAQSISPKENNYIRYTLYKWYLMLKSGYSSLLSVHDNQLLFYIQSVDNIYNVPYRMKDEQQYVCLNYHDYGSNIDFDKNHFTALQLQVAQDGQKSFSYKIEKLPDFKKADYVNKNLQFTLNDFEYNFKIKVNPDVKTIFKNYPVVDYGLQFNTPISEATRASLIPLLQKQIKKMKVKEGVDYLIQFARYAFVFEPDTKAYGTEKRLTPEQTLLYDNSDCEDRAALFFYLVKEIYKLPMIVVVYPQHVTVAIKFEKSFGDTIMYNGVAYTVCEPTPQARDLRLGELLPELKKQHFDVAYAYKP